MNASIVQRVRNARRWWLVRGESGKLWPVLFQPRSVVAHVRWVPRFSVDLDYESRCRAMLGESEYCIHEVNLFLDEMDTGDAIVTPDAGGGAAWFGLVTGEPFVDPETDWWMHRRCDWLDGLVTLTPDAALSIRKGPLGTVFDVSSDAKTLKDSLDTSA